MKTITKEIQKRIDNNRYYSTDTFILDCRSYIKAIRSGRILYDVVSVAASGMSRKITIRSFEGTMNKGYYRQYAMMLTVLGYKVGTHSEIHISGGGMDMLFNTNYNIIHDFKQMGFINKKSCDILSQRV